MRLLAVTAGDEAQGRLTEAEEVVGSIDLDGTFGLFVFGGILPGLFSGFTYVLIRRWLPAGRVGAVIFGALHLVLLATRLDPLRPGNEDFDLVGPGWLALVTFAVAAVVHGAAVVAIANRYSRALPPITATPWARAGMAAPLLVPVLFLVPFGVLLAPVAIGLMAALLVLRVEGRDQLVRSRAYLMVPRVLVVLVTVAVIPWTVLDLHAVVFR